MSDLVVREHRLPGIGWRYETSVGDDGNQSLVVVVEDRGPRHLTVLDESGEPLTSVRLPQAHAAGIAALLTGARSTVTRTRSAPERDLAGSRR
jgi:hypothetical protein